MFASVEGTSGENLGILRQFYAKGSFCAAGFGKKCTKQAALFANTPKSLIHEHVVVARASQNKEKTMFACAEDASGENLGILCEF